MSFFTGMTILGLIGWASMLGLAILAMHLATPSIIDRECDR